MAIPAELQRRLTHRYSEPHRHYHGLDHIAAMLERGEELGTSPAQELAIWFHDAIYDPLAGDNEERSAALARTLLPAAGFGHAIVDEVARIVLDTRTHVPTVDASGLVIDLDLMGLAAPWNEFLAAGRRIRREYAHVDDAVFAEARRRFFAAMLQRPRFFWTPFGAGLEAAARANLRRAVDGGD